MHDPSNPLRSAARVGASWEGFALEQTLQALRPIDAYFWATHGGAELDLLFTHRGARFGVELKFSEAPKISRSMRIALQDLQLEQLWIVHPGPHSGPIEERIALCALPDVNDLPRQLGQ